MIFIIRLISSSPHQTIQMCLEMFILEFFLSFHDCFIDASLFFFVLILRL